MVSNKWGNNKSTSLDEQQLYQRLASLYKDIDLYINNFGDIAYYHLPCLRPCIHSPGHPTRQALTCSLLDDLIPCRQHQSWIG